MKVIELNSVEFIDRYNAAFPDLNPFNAIRLERLEALLLRFETWLLPEEDFRRPEKVLPKGMGLLSIPLFDGFVYSDSDKLYLAFCDAGRVFGYAVGEREGVYLSDDDWEIVLKDAY